MIKKQKLKLSKFYSTYEELKPATLIRSQRPIPSFYSTYEELKLKDLPFIGITIV